MFMLCIKSLDDDDDDADIIIIVLNDVNSTQAYWMVRLCECECVCMWVYNMASQWFMSVEWWQTLLIYVNSLHDISMWSVVFCWSDVIYYIYADQLYRLNGFRLMGLWLWVVWLNEVINGSWIQKIFEYVVCVCLWIRKMGWSFVSGFCLTKRMFRYLNGIGSMDVWHVKQHLNNTNTKSWKAYLFFRLCSFVINLVGCLLISEIQRNRSS